MELTGQQQQQQQQQPQSQSPQQANGGLAPPPGLFPPSSAASTAAGVAPFDASSLDSIGKWRYLPGKITFYTFSKMSPYFTIR
jgi:hypothetical protein